MNVFNSNEPMKVSSFKMLNVAFKTLICLGNVLANILVV